MRNKFGWDLPPGVTNQMIEEQAGAFEEEKSNQCGTPTEIEGLRFICNMPADHTGLPHCEFGEVKGKFRYELSWWLEEEEEK